MSTLVGTSKAIVVGAGATGRTGPPGGGSSGTITGGAVCTMFDSFTNRTTTGTLGNTSGDGRAWNTLFTLATSYGVSFGGTVGSGAFIQNNSVGGFGQLTAYVLSTGSDPWELGATWSFQIKFSPTGLLGATFQVYISDGGTACDLHFSAFMSATIGNFGVDDRINSWFASVPATFWALDTWYVMEGYAKEIVGGGIRVYQDGATPPDWVFPSAGGVVTGPTGEFAYNDGSVVGMTNAPDLYTDIRNVPQPSLYYWKELNSCTGVVGTGSGSSFVTPRGSVSGVSDWSAKPPFRSYPNSGHLNYVGISTDIEVSGLTFSGTTWSTVALRFESCTGNIWIHDCDFDALGWDALNFITCTGGSLIIEWCRFGAFTASSHSGRLYPDVMQWDKSHYTGAFRNNKIKLNGYHEDIINFYQSGGPDASHLYEVHTNAIEGGLPISSGSGTGSLLADNTTVDGHIWVHDNTYLNPGQVGIGISMGLDCHVTDNIVYGQQATNSNVGIYTPYVGGSPNPGGHEVARNRVWFKNAAGSLNSFFNGGASGPIAGLSPQTNTFDDPTIDPTTLVVTL